MYEQHYHFTEKPFGMTPDRKYLFVSTSHKQALEVLQRALADRLCFAVVTGDVGTGKTTLCRALVEQGDRKLLPALLVNPPASEEELLAEMLASLGLFSRGEDATAATPGRPALASALQNFLQSLGALGAAVVLIIDEAQHMPPPVLGYIRQLSTLMMLERPLLQIVLVGQPSLTTLLRSPELKALDERLALRCELTPLTADETAQYILHRLALADPTRSVTFTADACALVHRYAAGIPRVVNLISHRALMAGFNAKVLTIDAPLVTNAVEGLELKEEAPARKSWLPQLFRR